MKDERQIVKRLLERMKFHRDEANRLHGLSQGDYGTEEDKEKLRDQSNHNSYLLSILCTIWDEYGSDKGLNKILDELKHGNE